jgi:hypothetical protein
MSKVSSKQRYIQLVDWLNSFKKTSKTLKQKPTSRLEYYSQKGN